MRELSRQIGVTYDSLKDFKWGRTQMLRGDNLQKVVIYLGESYQAMIPVVGMVGAGGEVRPVDDYAVGAAIEEVECPPGVDPATAVALKIRGDSMHPAFQDGWVIYYSERIEISASTKDALTAFKATMVSDPLARFFGKHCVVKLDDDRVLLKILKQGRNAGRYNLTSYNAPDIEDVAIRWAARIVFVKIT